MGIGTTATLVTMLGTFAVGAGAQQAQLGTEWNRNVTEFRGQINRRLMMICPPNGQPTSEVYGTDSYTDDSSVCSAAAHAGVITAVAGGPVAIVIGAGRSSYGASTRNGVTSRPFGRWSGSFSFDRSEGVGRVDWNTKATGLALASRPVTVECPPNGTIQTIYGTDQYTDDSSICTAAVHAGLITLKGGGQVAVESTPEQAAFPASVRNGIGSREYGSWPNGFRFGGTSVASATSEAAPAVEVPSTPSSPPQATAVPSGNSPTPTPSQPTLPAAPAPLSPPSGAAAPPQNMPVQSPVATPSNQTASPASEARPAGTAAGLGGMASASAVSGGARPRTKSAGDGSQVVGEAVSGGKLPAPTGVKAEYIGDGRVALSWDPIPGAVMYDMFVRNVGTSSWYPLTMDPITATEYIGDPAKISAGTVQIEVSGRRSKDDYNWTQTPALTINVPRYDGRYRVTVNGFRVNRETLDSPLNADGQHDEIYVRVGVREYDVDGKAVGQELSALSNTHGDINAPRWKQPGSATYRYYAGSATGFGGLVSGDGFPNREKPWAALPISNTTFPLFVWEGYLREGMNTVAIMPVIYEDDESPWDNRPEKQALLDLGEWVGAMGYQEIRGLGSVPISTAQRAGNIWFKTANVRLPNGLTARRMSLVDYAKGGVSKLIPKAQAVSIAQAFAMQHAMISTWQHRQQQLNLQSVNLLKNLTAASGLLLNTKDRPIGMAGIQGGQVVFDPTILRLTFETAEKFIATKENPNSDIPAGITSVRYVDTVPGGNGDYTLYLEIRRVP